MNLILHPIHLVIQKLSHEIELYPSGRKVGFNLLDDEEFTIPYITDTVPNSLAVHKIPTQDKRNMCITYINGEEPITHQGAIDELNCYQNPRGKSKVNISLCRRKRYQRIYIEDICSIFDQVRPVTSHLEVSLPKTPPTPNNIGEGLKVSQRQFWK